MNEARPDAATATAGHVDLHMHSTASDGARTPEEVVAAASVAGLSAIALTDHDTLGGLPLARSAAERLGIRVVSGVELSAVDGDREVHVLGLHLTRTADLEARLATFRDARRERAQQIVARLIELGVPLTLDAVLREAGSGAIGRPHVARALVAGGWAVDQRDAFDRWLGYRRPAFVPKVRLAMNDAIQMIHQAAGLAVLAHPGPDGRRARIEPLVHLGLDGLEVRHPSHSPEDVRRLTALADHFALVPSGGSDWHGTVEGGRMIGCMRIPQAWLERQDVRVARRAAQERVA